MKTVVLIYDKEVTPSWKVARMVKSFIHEIDSVDFTIRVFSWNDVTKEKLDWKKVARVVVLSKPKSEKVKQDVLSRIVRQRALIDLSQGWTSFRIQHRRSSSGKRRPTESDLLSLIHIITKMQELPEGKVYAERIKNRRSKSMIQAKEGT